MTLFDKTNEAVTKILSLVEQNLLPDLTFNLCRDLMVAHADLNKRFRETERDFNINKALLNSTIDKLEIARKALEEILEKSKYTSGVSSQLMIPKVAVEALRKSVL